MIRKAVCFVVVGLLAVGIFAAILMNDGSDKSMTQPESTPIATPEHNKNTQEQPLNISLPPILKSYIFHTPIRINNDTDFNAQFPGRVILGYEINGTGCGFCIYVGNCSQAFTVKDCYLHHATGRVDAYFWNTGLYLHKCSNGTVNGNNCSANYNQGIFLSSSKGNTLTNNTCLATSVGNGICLYSSSENTLISNTCLASYWYGIYLGYSSVNNTLTGNNCSMNKHGIYLDSSDINKLTNNTCTANYNGIVACASSDGNTLIGNTCSSNSNGGISLDQSSDNKLTSNTCSANYWSDIELVSSSNNTLMNNNCSANYYGIELYSSNNNTIISNNCSVNYYGVYLDSSSRNTITDNKYSANSIYGIYFSYSSKYNYIHHNTFANNNGAGSTYNPSHIQAYDNSTDANFWNSSTVGNYWSDWTGPDNNNDGIVDSSYIIDGGAGAQDYHPIADWSKIPEPSPLPVVICSVLLLTALLVRLRKK